MEKMVAESIFMLVWLVYELKAGERTVVQENVMKSMFSSFFLIVVSLVKRSSPKEQI